MGEQFDFGSLDEDKPRPTPKKKDALDKKEIRKIVDSMLKGEMKRFEDALTMTKVDITRNNNEQMSKYHDALVRELDSYKENLLDVWKEIYPTLVKMWGTSRGIGLKIARLNTMIIDHELEKGG